jgi:hypothetical protein
MGTTGAVWCLLALTSQGLVANRLPEEEEGEKEEGLMTDPSKVTLHVQ